MTDAYPAGRAYESPSGPPDISMHQLAARASALIYLLSIPHLASGSPLFPLAPTARVTQTEIDPSVQTAPISDALDGDAPAAVEFTPDGNHYLIAHRDTQNVMVYATSDGSLVTTIALDGSPVDLAVSSDGAFAVTANVFEDSLSIIDLGTLAQVSTVPVSKRPSSVGFTPDSTRIVSVSPTDATLDVVDLGTAAVTQSAQIVGVTEDFQEFAIANAARIVGPEFVCIDSATVAIPLTEAHQVAFVDLDTGVTEHIDTAVEPGGLDFVPSSNLLAVSHIGNAYQVTLVDTSTRTILGDIDFPGPLQRPVAMSGDGTKVAALVGLGSVYIADVATGSLSSGINGDFLQDLQTLSNGTELFVAGGNALVVPFDIPLLASNLQNFIDVDFFAVSPIDGNAVAVSTLRHEEVHRFDTAATPFSAYLGMSPTIPGIEADKPRRVAVSGDGQIAVSLNYLSRDLSIIDLQSQTLTGTVFMDASTTTDEYPNSVAITPDGTKAVVGSLNSVVISIVDLSSQAVQLVLPTEPFVGGISAGQIRISNDSRFAYVPSYASDVMHRIDLQTGSFVPGSLPLGDMDAVASFDFFRDAGVELSPDGSLLVACGNLSDTITLIDTTSWTVRATLAVGPTPSTVAFLPDSSGFVVGVEGSVGIPGTSELVEFQVTPAGATETSRIGVSSAPQGLAVDASGTRAFALGSFPFNLLEVVDLSSNTSLGAVQLPGIPRDLIYDSVHDKIDVLTGAALPDTGIEGLFQAEAHLVRVDPATLMATDQVDLDFDCTDLAAGGGKLAATAIDKNFIVVKSQEDELQADIQSISTSAGGAQALQVNFGPGFASDVYLVLGSANGISPGLVLDGIPIPLVLDNYLLYTLSSANTGPFQATVGVLDAQGRANCALTVPAQTFTSLAGIQLNHAGLALDPVFSTVLDASNPVELNLLP